MECWGARGGYGCADKDNGTWSSVRGDQLDGSTWEYRTQGKGGYTAGAIRLTDLSSLYVYVGQVGGNGNTSVIGTGGWNGGGNSCTDGQDNETSGGGGGATDIRLSTNNTTATTWNDFSSLKSRIMVAGGGGGSGLWSSGGGCGGNTSGGKPWVIESSTTYYNNGTQAAQVSGNSFGKGKDASRLGTNTCYGGGGGGYWGGGQASDGASYHGRSEYGGFGGSSYISGYSGCVAVLSGTSDSNITFRTETNAVTKASHTSGYVFTSNTSMINGDTSMPVPTAATGTMTGNNDSGYARITCKPYD